MDFSMPDCNSNKYNMYIFITQSNLPNENLNKSLNYKPSILVRVLLILPETALTCNCTTLASRRVNKCLIQCKLHPQSVNFAQAFR